MLNNLIFLISFAALISIKEVIPLTFKANLDYAIIKDKMNLN